MWATLKRDQDLIFWSNFISVFEYRIQKQFRANFPQPPNRTKNESNLFQTPRGKHVLYFFKHDSLQKKRNNSDVYFCTLFRLFPPREKSNATENISLSSSNQKPCLSVADRYTRWITFQEAGDLPRWNKLYTIFGFPHLEIFPRDEARQVEIEKINMKRWHYNETDNGWCWKWRDTETRNLYA